MKNRTSSRLLSSFQNRAAAIVSKRNIEKIALNSDRKRGYNSPGSEHYVSPQTLMSKTPLNDHKGNRSPGSEHYVSRQVKHVFHRFLNKIT